MRMVSKLALLSFGFMIAFGCESGGVNEATVESHVEAVITAIAERDSMALDVLMDSSGRLRTRALVQSAPGLLEALEGGGSLNHWHVRGDTILAEWLPSSGGADHSVTFTFLTIDGQLRLHWIASQAHGDPR